MGAVRAEPSLGSALSGENAESARKDIGGPQARVPLYMPYADFFQYQVGAGRLAGRA